MFISWLNGRLEYFYGYKREVHQYGIVADEHGMTMFWKLKSLYGDHKELQLLWLYEGTSGTNQLTTPFFL